MNSEIRKLLESVQAGKTSVDDAMLELKKAPFEDIGYAKAKSIALSHAGVRENKAHDMDIELDDEDGRLVYEVEFKSGNMEYAYEIDASSGAVLKHEAELDD